MLKCFISLDLCQALPAIEAGHIKIQKNKVGKNIHPILKLGKRLLSIRSSYAGT